MITNEQQRAEVFVDAGIRVLDAKKYGWFKRVNLNRFDARDFHRCPLAHAYGDYNKGLAAISVRSVSEAATLGFALGSELMHWDTLNSIWLRKIRERRAGITSHRSSRH